MSGQPADITKINIASISLKKQGQAKQQLLNPFHCGWPINQPSAFSRWRQINKLRSQRDRLREKHTFFAVILN